MLQRAFPSWATVPTGQNLATGRVIHFFFAWLLVATLLVWAVASFLTGHVRRDIVPTPKDLRALPQDIADHARLRFHHSRDYNVLQKLAYAGVLFVALPADDPDRALHVARRQCDAALARRICSAAGRRPARSISSSCWRWSPSSSSTSLMIVAAGPLNETALDHHRLVPHRPGANPAEGGTEHVRKLILSRRRFLTGAAVGASGMPLSGCDAFDGLADATASRSQLLEERQHADLSRRSGCCSAATAGAGIHREPTSASRSGRTASTRPDDAVYKALLDQRLCRLPLEVDRTRRASRCRFRCDRDHRNMPARTQITRHDCVEGWSCIAKWTGTPLGAVLDAARAQSRRRASSSSTAGHRSADGLSGDVNYYESDRPDRRPPPADDPRLWTERRRRCRSSNGAPLRVRVERQLGYKMPKYLHRDRAGRQLERSRRRQGRLLGRPGLRLVWRHLKYLYGLCLRPDCFMLEPGPRARSANPTQSGGRLGAGHREHLFRHSGRRHDGRAAAARPRCARLFGGGFRFPARRQDSHCASVGKRPFPTARHETADGGGPAQREPVVADGWARPGSGRRRCRTCGIDRNAAWPHAAHAGRTPGNRGRFGERRRAACCRGKEPVSTSSVRTHRFRHVAIRRYNR